MARAHLLGAAPELEIEPKDQQDIDAGYKPAVFIDLASDTVRETVRVS